MKVSDSSAKNKIWENTLLVKAFKMIIGQIHDCEGDNVWRSCAWHLGCVCLRKYKNSGCCQISRQCGPSAVVQMSALLGGAVSSVWWPHILMHSGGWTGEGGQLTPYLFTLAHWSFFLLSPHSYRHRRVPRASTHPHLPGGLWVWLCGAVSVWSALLGEAVAGSLWLPAGHWVPGGLSWQWVPA